MGSRGRVEGTRAISSAKEKMLSTRNAVLKAAPRLGGPEQMYPVTMDPQPGHQWRSRISSVRGEEPS